MRDLIQCMNQTCTSAEIVTVWDAKTPGRRLDKLLPDLQEIVCAAAGNGEPFFYVPTIAAKRLLGRLKVVCKELDSLATYSESRCVCEDICKFVDELKKKLVEEWTR
jgi:hypothetical protein